MTTFSELSIEELFPESDGRPMADNTEQFRWIVLIKENLEILFADRPDVFVAGDLLWYPVQSMSISPKAPDVMVVFGRPKGRRGAYRQWLEEDIPPQVVFEVLSPSNTTAEMKGKLEFYERYGPDNLELLGWRCGDSGLESIEPMNGWVSPRLGVQFEWKDQVFRLYRPDGERFLSSVELARSREQERRKNEIFAAKLRDLGVNPEDLM